MELPVLATLRQLAAQPAAVDQEQLVRRAASVLRRQSGRLISVLPGGDYDFCQWLIVDEQVSADLAPSEIWALLQPGRPVWQLRIAVSIYGPYAAAQWQRWALDDRGRVVATRAGQAPDGAARRRLIMARRALGAAGLRVLGPAVLAAPLPGWAELGVPATVATVLFSARW